MPPTFSEQPILNSPYEYPARHWELGGDGIPTDRIAEQRREAKHIVPVPPPRRSNQQRAMQLGIAMPTDEGQEYDPSPIINEIRRHVDAWRQIPNPSSWGVSPETARLLQHWRSHQFAGYRPFFCQVEAAETVIWLTEVAGLMSAGTNRRREYEVIRRHIAGANEQANPELFRLALKMATGAGKTTVMAMLIAWQTINAVRHPQRRRFTKNFLIATPGITIRDRLRSLLPNDAENYYEHRELVPKDMLSTVKQAQVVITNFHAFRLREREAVSPNTRRLVQGRTGPELSTLETEGQMLRRVMPELMSKGNVLVFNDEGHHCYRQRTDGEPVERELDAEEKPEAEENNESARVWISGVEAVKRKVGVTGVIDLSATPFFLRGSGYAEGTLFPWTVCDFSLMDAIESGIVKIPRVPIDDNVHSENRPVFRDLWKHISGTMPRAGRRRANAVRDPLSLPTHLQSALDALYANYERTFNDWQEAGIEEPPVFIAVCNNTATSKLVYEYISGFERPGEDGKSEPQFLGKFDLFSNYENGIRRAMPRTLLIDSEQMGATDALPPGFRAAAAPAIERFRRERVQRTGDRNAADGISDEDLLREMMNTVGKKERLGAGVRCVVSVSMLTEGWDANTVTHVIGVRAFGTQLLCEQVVGRALRRQSYELNEDNLFDVEYADVLGIPFDFTKSDKPPPPPPAPTVRVHAVSPERDRLEIQFPNITAYRVELPDEKLSARFGEDSVLRLTTELTGPTRTQSQGIIGEGTSLTVEKLRETRLKQIEFKLTAHVLQHHLRETGESVKMHLFGELQRIVRQWLDQCLRCDPDTYPAQVLYREIADLAGQRIKAAIASAIQSGQDDAEQRIKAVTAPYTPVGSTQHVNFTTRKWPRQPNARFHREIIETNPGKCHINLAVCDDGWEARFCRIVDGHDQVISYVKNHGLGLEVPYRMGSVARTYIPDFIVRIDDGRGSDDPLNLIAEIKGYRGEDAIAKAETMKSYWIPGVNNLGVYGRWAFHEFTSAEDMKAEFDDLVKEARDSAGTPENIHRKFAEAMLEKYQNHLGSQ